MLQKIKKMMKNQDAFIYAAGRNGDSFRPERGR